MVDESVVVDVLALVSHDCTVESEFGAFATEHDLGGVACGSVEEGDVVVAHAAVASCLDVEIAEAVALGVRLLEFVHVQAGVVGAEHFCHLGGEEAHCVHRVVAEEECGFGALLEDNEQAAVDHHVDSRTEKVDYLDRFVNAGVSRHIHYDAFLNECGVEGCNGIGSRIGKRCVVLLCEFGVCLGKCLE